MGCPGRLDIKTIFLFYLSFLVTLRFELGAFGLLEAIPQPFSALVIYQVWSSVFP
jgi:hypothetical protein